MLEYWSEETPPVNVLIGAIARTLGCKFGKSQMGGKVTDAESLLHQMRLDPDKAPKWTPKHNVLTFGKS